MNIYTKMSLATMQIATVAKNLQVDAGKGKSYKAVSEADVLAAVKPVEAEYGIYSYPLHREIIESGTITSKNQYGETQRLFMRVATTYRFVNVDTPEEYIDIVTYGDGVDSQDKAPGKAMTYADKYALLKAYKVQTGDDPDKDASQDLVSAQLTKAEADLQKPATTKQREMYMQACTDKQVDAVENLKAIGWQGGTMTQEQFYKAMKRLG